LEHLLEKNDIESAFGVLEENRSEAIEGIHTVQGDI
jgi:hypothetical protein